MPIQPTAANPASCSEAQKCLEILHLILDGEGTEEDKIYLDMHLEHCIECFKNYELEKEIRKLMWLSSLTVSAPKQLVKRIQSSKFIKKG